MDTPPFDWNSLPPPEAIAWPIYPEDSPARSNDESTEAFNEAAARAAFGDGCVDWLRGMQFSTLYWSKPFTGDWWMFAMLLRCSARAKIIDPQCKDPARFSAFHDIKQSLRWRGLGVHLEHAKLAMADLQYADLQLTHLERANLREADLRRALLSNAYFEHASFSLANLAYAHLRWSHLEHADLCSAKLQYSNLEGADLENALLITTKLEFANLDGAQLEHADFSGANLKLATFYNANLDDAILRWTRGILFDDTKVNRLDIEGNAPDPWSTLRRTYTGPMFFVHLLLLIGFLLPYAAKVLTLTTTARGYDALRTSLEAGEGVPPGGEVVRTWLEHFDASHTQTHALWVLLGGTHAWWPLMVITAVIIILYNILRGHLTLTIGVLRDQADRVERTPTLAEYYGACHPLAGKDAGVRRIPAVWWRHVSEWWKSKRLWKNRGMLKPWTVIGPYRLHLIARWLFWISIASVVLHVGSWLWTTTVPVPK